jgi:mRNA-degrading endonuclease toxin of MazEF toxin-antitoxin module
MADPERGEVWLLDLGLVAKIRPCLVLSIAVDPGERILATVVPHTTSTRGTRFEAVVPQRTSNPERSTASNLSPCRRRSSSDGSANCRSTIWRPSKTSCAAGSVYDALQRRRPAKTQASRRRGVKTPAAVDDMR